MGALPALPAQWLAAPLVWIAAVALASAGEAPSPFAGRAAEAHLWAALQEPDSPPASPPPSVEPPSAPETPAPATSPEPPTATPAAPPTETPPASATETPAESPPPTTPDAPASPSDAPATPAEMPAAETPRAEEPSAEAEPASNEMSADDASHPKARDAGAQKTSRSTKQATKATKAASAAARALNDKPQPLPPIAPTAPPFDLWGMILSGIGIVIAVSLVVGAIIAFRLNPGWFLFGLVGGALASGATWAVFGTLAAYIANQRVGGDVHSMAEAQPVFIAILWRLTLAGGLFGGIASSFMLGDMPWDKPDEDDDKRPGEKGKRKKKKRSPV